MSLPTVTVVIPAFNAERYIGEALESIRTQTICGVEVVVVDDGSTDGTVSAVKQFENSLDITILRQLNSGPSAARNAGIRRARGQYCALLDADDVMLPELLSTQACLLNSDIHLGLVLSDVTTFDERGTIRETHWNLSQTVSHEIFDRLLLENFVTTSAVMVPKERLVEAGMFNERRRVAEDYELWLRIAARWKVALIDRPLVRYRYRPSSLSYDKLNSARCALDVIESFWREHQTYLNSHVPLYRRSLGRHMLNVAAAAVAAGSRGTAIPYLIRSLRNDPTNVDTWKWSVKAIVGMGSRRPVGNVKRSAPTS